MPYDLSRFAGIDVMKACCSHPGVVYRKRLDPPTPRRGSFSLDRLSSPLRELSLARFVATAGWKRQDRANLDR